MNTQRQSRNWQELESQERVLITCEISQEHSSHQEHGLLLSAGSPKECSLRCYAPGSFQMTPAVYSDIMLAACLNPKLWTTALGRGDLRESRALQDSGHDHDSFLLQIIPPVGSVCFETEVLQIQVNRTSSFMCTRNYRKNKRVVHSCGWVLNLAEDMELSGTVLDNHTHGGTRMLKLITSYNRVPFTIFVDNNWIGLWLSATFQQLPPNRRKHFDLVEEIISKKWWNYESSSQFCHSFIVLFCCKTRSRTKSQDANEEKKKNMIILLKIPMKRKKNMIIFTSTSLPTNWSPNLVTAWQVARPSTTSLSIMSTPLCGDCTAPKTMVGSPSATASTSLTTPWTLMKSKPFFVSVPVLSKQNTRIFPAIAIRFGLTQKIPQFCNGGKEEEYHHHELRIVSIVNNYMMMLLESSSQFSLAQKM